ncbi:cytochrome P450 [Streptomyces violarus]|uniref:cytochrome P450 n=1 Tax=Streptomyces violarus TaxID=67380 RepID=UPI0021BF7534|nr:cytochrome P450 [Streptomyces violarus]MCT9145036.1 cytochrome P450 [Streptomyces violarus]
MTMPSTSAETAGVPEAPGAWPLVGHAPRLLRDRLAFLQDTRMHGDLVAIRIGPRRAYVVNGLELVRDVLTRRSSQFQLSPQFQLMRRIIGNGLLVTDGAFHRRQRRLVLPAFHREHVRGYASVMASLAQNRFDGWREGVLPALDEEFGSLAAEVVARCLFSSDCDQRTADRVAEDLPHLMTWVGSRGFDPSGLLAKLPTPVNRRFHTSNTRLHGTVRRIIAERRASGVDGRTSWRCSCGQPTRRPGRPCPTSRSTTRR